MLKPSLQLKLGQSLTMTPQLQQAIRLLQMPALELQAHIRELLESNVMLEPVEEPEQTGIFEAIQSPAERAAPEFEAPPRDSAQVEVEIVADNWYVTVMEKMRFDDGLECGFRVTRLTHA